MLIGTGLRPDEVASLREPFKRELPEPVGLRRNLRLTWAQLRELLLSTTCAQRKSLRLPTGCVLGTDPKPRRGESVSTKDPTPQDLALDGTIVGCRRTLLTCDSTSGCGKESQKKGRKKDQKDRPRDGAPSRRLRDVLHLRDYSTSVTKSPCCPELISLTASKARLWSLVLISRACGPSGGARASLEACYDEAMKLPLVIAFALASAPSTAAQSVQLLHQSFDTIPGAKEIHGFRHAAVNDSGEWVITAAMLDIGANMSAGNAVFGPAGLLLYSENPVPSLGNATFFRPDDVRITEAGEFVTQCTIRISAQTFVEGVLADDELIRRVPLPVDAAGVPANAIWSDIQTVRVTPKGRVFVSGFVAWPDGPNFNAIVEYRLDGKTVIDARLIASENQTPAGSTVPLDSIVGLDAGEDGRPLLIGRTAADRYFLLHGDDVLAISGEPSVVPGEAWSSNLGGTLGTVNSRGDTAFIAELESLFSTVLVKNGTVLRRRLDVLPAIAPYQIERFSTLTSRHADVPFMLESGAVLWAARWTNPELSLGGGLFLDDRLIVEEGVTMVGTKIISGIRSDKMQVSPNGRWVIFECRLTEAGTQDSTYGVVLVDLAEGTEYCAPAIANSTGFSGSLTASAAVVAPGAPLDLIAHGLPTNSRGYFLVAPQAGLVVTAGGSQGTLCLSQPIGRFRSQAMDTGPGGFLSATVDSNALPLTPTQSAMTGETWHFQAWYRDLNPGPTSNFTSAVSVTF